MGVFEAIITALLASGAWVVVLAFLGKSLMSTWLAKDIELLKGRIAAQNAEAQIVLARVNEKRADAVLNIYLALVGYADTAKKFVYQAQHVEEVERQELLNSMSESANHFRDVYKKSHLYLSEDTCTHIQSVFKEVHVPSHKFIFSLGQYFGSGEFTEEEFTEEWEKAFTSFADKIPALVSELESQFRSLLGVRNES